MTEIFIRVNSAGAELSQADFAMSKIAANETYGGNLLRKAIDYFCHLAVAPEFLSRIEKGDKAFAASEFLPQMRWLKDVNDDIYDPTYTDMLRVAFTSEFRRGPPAYGSSRHRFAGRGLQGGGGWTRTLGRAWTRRSAPTTLAEAGPRPSADGGCRRAASRTRR